MRVSALFREAWRGTVTGASKAPTLFVIYLFIACCFVGVEVFTVTQQINLAHHYQESGAAVTTIEHRGAIDGAACSRLAALPEIHAAGAIRNDESEITLVALSGAPIPKFDVTSGFAAVLGIDKPLPEGVLLPSEISHALGVRAGSAVVTVDGQFLVANSYDYPSDGRRAGFGYAVLSPTHNDEPFDECWVDVWPQIENIRTLLHSVVLPLVTDESSPQTPVIATLNPQLGATFTGYTAFTERISRFTPYAMAVVCFALGVAAFWVRRLQLASAMHNGMKKRDMLLIGIWETLIWCVPATILVGCIVVGLTTQLDTADMLPLMQASFAIPLTGLLCCIAGATIGLVFVREHSLFRYFKTR